MRQFALVSALALAFVGTASAADLPAKAPAYVAPVVAPLNWTGFYLGINGGGAWGRSRHTDTTGATTGNFDITGGMIGPTIGFNWQTGAFVFGIEADWDWANITGSSTTLCPAGCSTTIRSIGTLRPRIGWAWSSWMAYLTGGLAWDNVRAGQPGFTTTADRAGWTAGLGVEALLNPNWSIKLEYLYAWFNDTGYTVAIPVSVQQRDISMLRLGVNYHFR